jgi:Ulp1 family protease
VLRKLREWLRALWVRLRPSDTPVPFDDVNDPNGWCTYTAPNMPQQENDYDCGLFTIVAAECVVRGLPLNNSPFSQAQIVQARRRLLHEVFIRSQPVA